MSINISTLNLCLGLRNKKYLVKNLLEEKKIDILCMQETEITGDINVKELETSNYSLELEVNSVKSRAAVSYFSGMELCSDRIGLGAGGTGLGTGFIR